MNLIISDDIIHFLFFQQNTSALRDDLDSFLCSNETSGHSARHLPQPSIFSSSSTSLSSSNSSNYSCSYCGKTFRYKNGCTKHESLCISRPRSESSSSVESPMETDFPKQISQGTFNCLNCYEQFPSRIQLRLHQRHCNIREQLTCKHCKRCFKRKRDLKVHEPKCTKLFICTFCERQYKTRTYLRYHMVDCPAKDPCDQCGHISKTMKEKSTHLKFHAKQNVLFRCQLCGGAFQSRSDLFYHRSVLHGGAAEDLQPEPWNDIPWINDNGRVNNSLRKIYTANRGHILSRHRHGDLASTYNFPTDNFADGANEIDNQLNGIFLEQNNTFKINLALGMILRNIEDGTFRYFVAHDNNTLFPQPLQISARRDLESLLEKLRAMDWFNYYLGNRPNSKFELWTITNVVYFVSKTSFPLGYGFLPEHIKNSKSIIALDVKRSGTIIEDNLCLFRCLALFFQRNNIENGALEYYFKWQRYALVNLGMDLPKKPRDFKGIDFHLLPEIEKCFEVSVHIYEKLPDDSVILRYSPSILYSNSIYMNLYEHHLSYVQNFKAYAQKFQCEKCNRIFNLNYRYKRHAKSCTNRTNLKYMDGFHRNPKTIFEELEEFGICVPEDQRLFKYFAVYDAEAILETVDAGNAEKLKWKQAHRAISVAVNSNVPDFEKPVCFVNPDLKRLTSTLVDYLHSIQTRSLELCKEYWSVPLEELEKLRKKWDLKHKANESDCIHGEEEEEKEEEDFVLDAEENEYVLEQPDDIDDYENIEFTQDGLENNEEILNSKSKDFNFIKMHRAVERLHKRFIEYISLIPVLGFNSSKYDINLFKEFLFEELNLHDKNMSSFVVKRNNAYIAICTDRLKFLDIAQYLAPGTSYAKFLAAYRVEERKGFFCYEYLDHPDKLKEEHLPPHEAFHSSLKDSNISCEEYVMVQQTWIENDMKCLQDLLVHYNIGDVGPFVTAVSRMQTFYFERNIDVFKDAVSVPGIARRLLFQSALDNGSYFERLGEENEDLYMTYKKNIVGGPAIVFHRYHKSGETKIRGNKTCEKIIGFDANALYLWSIAQEMPSGFFIRRMREDNFRPIRHSIYTLMYIWMEWESRNSKKLILHALNNEQEKRVGPYLVDGFCSLTNTVYEVRKIYFILFDGKYIQIYIFNIFKYNKYQYILLYTL